MPNYYVVLKLIIKLNLKNKKIIFKFQKDTLQIVSAYKYNNFKENKGSHFKSQIREPVVHLCHGIHLLRTQREVSIS